MLNEILKTKNYKISMDKLKKIKYDKNIDG